MGSSRSLPRVAMWGLGIPLFQWDFQSFYGIYITWRKRKAKYAEGVSVGGGEGKDGGEIGDTGMVVMSQDVCSSAAVLQFFVCRRNVFSALLQLHT